MISYASRESENADYMSEHLSLNPQPQLTNFAAAYYELWLSHQVVTKRYEWQSWNLELEVLVLFHLRCSSNTIRLVFQCLKENY